NDAGSQLGTNDDAAAADGGGERSPRGRAHGQHEAVAVNGVTHQDAGHPKPVGGGADLYALPSVGIAVRARAPVRADAFHSWSSTLAIRSRDAATGSACVCSDRKTSVACSTMAWSSVRWPAAVASRCTISPARTLPCGAGNTERPAGYKVPFTGYRSTIRPIA